MTPGAPFPPDAQALFDEAACGLLQTNAHGTILHANLTFCRWVGHEPSDLVGRRKLQDLFTMGGRIFHQTHWVPLMQMQGSLSEVKFDVSHRDGSSLPMVMNALRRLHDGVVVHEIAVFVARDRDSYERELIESRKKLEAQAVEARRLEVAAKDRAIFAEQMIGIVSHDLRNPLSAIHMSAALLGRGETRPNQLRVLDRLTRATQRANRLITELLDFTQARIGGGLSVSPKAIDLHSSIAECMEELATAFAGKRLVHRKVGEGECVADADRLAQLTGNLVANALVYGDAQHGVEVTTTISPTTFSLAVHNAGDPIPAELRARLFQPMTRGVPGSNDVRSVGLGLFIVMEIAKAHRGSIAVESTAQAGTTFTATMPRNERASVPP